MSVLGQFPEIQAILQQLATVHANQTQIIIPKLTQLLTHGVTIMSALDDLKAAEAALADDVMNAITLIQQLQAGDNVPAADVEAVVANLTDLHNKLMAAAPAPAAPSAGP